MSKMSELHVELSQQAYDMGYQSLEEAEDKGCVVDYENHKLLPPEEAAHRALILEKEEIVNSLIRAIKFIEENIK